MNRLIRPLAILAAIVLLSACLERKQSTVINPDGSGKMVIDSLIIIPEGLADKKPDPADLGKQMATSMISKAQGIDAWKDVVVDVAADGRAHFAATAYFPDISKVKIDGVIPAKWTKDERGNYLLTLKEEGAGAPKDPPKMTDEEVAAAIAKSKAEFKEQQPMTQMIFESMKFQVSFTLPGQVTSTNILSKSADGKSVELAVEGKKMLEAMDKVMADDKALGSSIRAGKKVEQDDDLMLEKMYGKKGPISATVAGGGKPLFDYKTEMEAAKAAQADMFKKVGIDLNAKPPMMPSMPEGK